MEEYFDVLDEKGNKTGKKKLRNEVHRDGDWHRTVHIWIINEQGNVLLQRRSEKKDSYKNMLDISCAGHIDAGETSIESAIREIKEELDLDATKKDLQYIETLKECAKPSPTFIDNEFCDMYILRTDKKIEEMKFQTEEISEILYVPYDKFKEMLINKQPDILVPEEEFELLFKVLEKN